MFTMSFSSMHENCTSSMHAKKVAVYELIPRNMSIKKPLSFATSLWMGNFNVLLYSLFQLMPTPQGLVSAHQPLFNVVQGGLATGGTAGAVGAVAAAATAGGLVGGVPFSPYHHQALAAAASATHQPGGGGGAGGVATQPLAGAPGVCVCV